jgi:DNA-binding transcriptional ArsR family regulator
MKIEIARMQADADAASDLLKALANRHRLLILCQLIERERSVGELAELLGVRNSTASQHLALMRRDGLVVARRDGHTIWYSISSAPARALLETLYRIYCVRSDTPPRTKSAKMNPSRRRAAEIPLDQ